MVLPIFVNKFFSTPNLDRKLSHVLKNLLISYPLYYFVVYFLTLFSRVYLLDYLNAIPILLILGIILASLTLPFATRYGSLNKQYVLFAFISFFLIVPFLIFFESFIRTDFSFVD